MRSPVRRSSKLLDSIQKLAISQRNAYNDGDESMGKQTIRDQRMWTDLRHGCVGVFEGD